MPHLQCLDLPLVVLLYLVSGTCRVAVQDVCVPHLHCLDLSLVVLLYLVNGYRMCVCHIYNVLICHLSCCCTSSVATECVCATFTMSWLATCRVALPRQWLQDVCVPHLQCLDLSLVVLLYFVSGYRMCVCHIYNVFACHLSYCSTSSVATGCVCATFTMSLLATCRVALPRQWLQDVCVPHLQCLCLPLVVLLYLLACHSVATGCVCATFTMSWLATCRVALPRQWLQDVCVPHLQCLGLPLVVLLYLVSGYRMCVCHIYNVLACHLSCCSTSSVATGCVCATFTMSWLATCRVALPRQGLQDVCVPHLQCLGLPLVVLLYLVSGYRMCVCHIYNVLACHLWCCSTSSVATGCVCATFTMSWLATCRVALPRQWLQDVCVPHLQCLGLPLVVLLYLVSGYRMCVCHIYNVLACHLSCCSTSSVATGCVCATFTMSWLATCRVALPRQWLQGVCVPHLQCLGLPLVVLLYLVSGYRVCVCATFTMSWLATCRVALPRQWLQGVCVPHLQCLGLPLVVLLYLVSGYRVCACHIYNVLVCHLSCCSTSSVATGCVRACVTFTMGSSFIDFDKSMLGLQLVPTHVAHVLVTHVC